MKKIHPLPGLETDNLLGFLALLGLLRALEHERPSWFPRAFFNGVPLRSNLILAEEGTEEEIASAASAGCAAYAEHFTFGSYHDLKFDGAAARILLDGALGNDVTASLMSALCSDVAVRVIKGVEHVEPTPLCAIFGQGHQSFLDRLGTVSRGVLPSALKGKKPAPDLNDPAIVARALFAPWTRSDPTESFRWDFEEYRRYALRYVDPSKDPPLTEHGANRLAILGILSFQSAPTVRRGRVNLATRGVSRGGKHRRPRITWPIWTRPASLEAVHAMLDEPELAKDQPSFDVLGRHGIKQVRRVHRVMTGKFINFTRAEALTESSSVTGLST